MFCFQDLFDCFVFPQDLLSYSCYNNIFLHHWCQSTLDSRVYHPIGVYLENPTNLDIRKICCNHPVIEHRGFPIEYDASKRCRSDSKLYWSNCSSRSNLIWVFTVSLGQPVRKLKDHYGICGIENTAMKPTRAAAWQNKQNDVHAAKIQISLGIHPVWSVFIVRMKKPWVLSYPLSAQRRLWSDWADAQADPSLHWALRSFCWVCHAVAHIFSPKIVNGKNALLTEQIDVL